MYTRQGAWKSETLQCVSGLRKFRIHIKDITKVQPRPVDDNCAPLFTTESRPKGGGVSEKYGLHDPYTAQHDVCYMKSVKAWT